MTQYRGEHKTMAGRGRHRAAPPPRIPAPALMAAGGALAAAAVAAGALAATEGPDVQAHESARGGTPPAAAAPAAPAQAVSGTSAPFVLAVMQDGGAGRTGCTGCWDTVAQATPIPPATALAAAPGLGRHAAAVPYAAASPVLRTSSAPALPGQTATGAAAPVLHRATSPATVSVPMPTSTSRSVSAPPPGRLPAWPSQSAVAHQSPANTASRPTPAAPGRGRSTSSPGSGSAQGAGSHRAEPSLGGRHSAVLPPSVPTEAPGTRGRQNH